MPLRRWFITWIHDELLSIGHTGTHFSEIWIKIPLSFKKIYFKMSHAKHWTFCSEPLQCVVFVRGAPTSCFRFYSGRDKMAAIFQTIYSNAFSWMKMCEFWLRVQWSLFLRVQSTIFQQCFRQCHFLNQWWLVYWRISLGLNELMKFRLHTSCQCGEII